MSIEKPLREMVQAELRSRLGPLHKAITRMDERLDVIDELVEVVQRLAPLATRMQSLQLSLPGLSLPVVERGGRGRAVAAPVPPARARSAEVVPAPKGRPSLAAVAREAEREQEEERRCAVIGCKRPARSKGYCSAHYQKLRLLVKTNRRPEQWVDDAGPQSVADVVLPRGRAASKAKEEAEPPQRPEPQEPPKPKAWVRKKGGQERISLH